MGAFGRAFWIAFLALVVLFGVLVKYDSGPTSLPSESTAPNPVTSNTSDNATANATSPASTGTLSTPTGPTPGG